MMKLKQYLKNMVRVVLLFSLLLSSCLQNFEPTYKEKDIPHIIKKICKEEYNLDVITRRTNNTLWIYLPSPKILHQDYGKEDKFFSEEMSEKLRNILTTVGRVLTSSDYTPEFLCLVISDINIGLDYTLLSYVLDIKKSYAGFIPWTEANRRYVFELKLATEAIGDREGRHLESYDIKFTDFLTRQIAQRIAIHFQEEERKKYFKITKSEGRFENNVFTFEYSIEEILKPEKEVDIKKEILKIITYCIKAYEFKDFLLVELKNITTGEKSTFSKSALEDFL